MMNMPETAGEPSCKRQENGDASSGPERPLKKARFAWQVKGNRKYHLKNDANEGKLASTSSLDSETASTESESDNNELVGNTEQNLEILGDYLLKQDFNTLDSVITDPAKSLLKPSTSLSTEKLECPRYVSSRTTYSGDTLISPTLVTSQSYNEDQCIARWQARQMAKGFVDNTINRVLDSWMVAPLPADIDNQFLALDVAEFINNLPGANSIENEGILMAISAHGLQNTSGSSSNDEGSKEDGLINSTVFPSRSSSPIQSEEEIENIKTDNTDSQMVWSYDNDKEANSSGSDFNITREESSSELLNYFNNYDHQQSFEVDNIGNDYTSHFDFMDAAVSFAIQNKGLTSFGTDYG